MKAKQISENRKTITKYLIGLEYFKSLEEIYWRTFFWKQIKKKCLLLVYLIDEEAEIIKKSGHLSQAISSK